jgi:hypothetical protein
LGQNREGRQGAAVQGGKEIQMKTTPSRPLTLVHDSIEAKLAPLKILVIDDQSTDARAPRS